MNEPSRAQKIHRRLELLVALLAIVGIALILSSADPAAADEAPATTTTTDPFVPSPPEPLPALDDSGSGDEASAEPTEPPAPGAPPASEPAPDAIPAEPADPPAAESQRSGERRAATLRINSAKVSPARIFLGSRRSAAFRFRLGGNGGRRLLVKVVKVSTGAVKKRFRLGRVGVGERQRVAWDGGIGGRGGFVGQGEYAFRVFAHGERAKVSPSSGNPRFNFYEHRFPLLGRHTYGDGFGAGRGHQGQDVFAACGTRIVAARGGRVQTKAYQSAAGYYVVIDGRGTGQDYVYMHMERGDRPSQGSWVHTGELIGHESDTGDATGCHLHFELWTSPGWYEGGHAKAPTRALQRWDRWS